MTNLKSLSKFILLVLRHRPYEFGLVLDSDSFARFDNLLAVVMERFSDDATREDVESVIAG